MSLLQTLFQGDALSQMVVGVLLLMSVASWVLILWRTWLLRRAAATVPLSISVFWQSPGARAADERLTRIDALALVLPMVQVAAQSLEQQGAGDTTDSASLQHQVSLPQRLTRMLREALVSAQARLQFGQAVLATVGATAPFVGLLGTVWGIYHALQGMAAEGQVSIDKVSGPVGEALVMTAAGLGVAIPAVLAYNVLGRLSGRIEAELEAFAHDVRELVIGLSDAPAQG